MKLPGALRRSGHALPGVVGVARVDRRVDVLLRRVGPGDIAVLDHADLDRRTADALLEAGVVGVVNAAPSISGRFPNLGPEALVAAGVALVDRAGPAVLAIRDGTRLRLHGGGIYAREKELATGVEQSADSIADLMLEARSGLGAQLEAFSANTIEFLHHERSLIIDGVGVPDVGVRIRDREVLVVAAGYDEHNADLAALRRFIREYQPVLIGVESGADTLVRAGYRPHLVVGDPGRLAASTLTSGAELVLPAHPDGHAPGLHTAQDLGLTAVTFPSLGNPEDLALLLADVHGARLVVTVGFQATLHEFLDRGRSGSNPSTFLTRLRLGAKVVDGRAVAALYRGRVSAGAMALVVVSALVAMLAAALVSDVGGAYLSLAEHTWADLLSRVQGGG